MEPPPLSSSCCATASHTHGRTVVVRMSHFTALPVKVSLRTDALQGLCGVETSGLGGVPASTLEVASSCGAAVDDGAAWGTADELPAGAVAGAAAGGTAAGATA